MCFFARCYFLTKEAISFLSGSRSPPPHEQRWTNSLGLVRLCHFRSLIGLKTGSESWVRNSHTSWHCKDMDRLRFAKEFQSSANIFLFWQVYLDAFVFYYHSFSTPMMCSTCGYDRITMVFSNFDFISISFSSTYLVYRGSSLDPDVLLPNYFH